MMHPLLFIQGGDWFGASKFAARGMQRSIRDIAIHGPKCTLNQIAAVIDFSDNAIGAVATISGDGRLSPTVRSVTTGIIGPDVSVAAIVQCGDYDSGLIRRLATRYRWIDG